MAHVLMTALIVQGKMSCLMVNDIDAGLGRFGEFYFVILLFIRWIYV